MGVSSSRLCVAPLPLPCHHADRGIVCCDGWAGGTTSEEREKERKTSPSCTVLLYVQCERASKRNLGFQNELPCDRCTAVGFFLHYKIELRFALKLYIIVIPMKSIDKRFNLYGLLYGFFLKCTVYIHSSVEYVRTTLPSFFHHPSIHLSSFSCAAVPSLSPSCFPFSQA